MASSPMPLAGVMVIPPLPCELASACSMAFALWYEAADSRATRRVAKSFVAPPAGAHVHDFRYVGVMCAPAPTVTPTTALISAGVRSGQASVGGAAVTDGAAAAKMRMARTIAPRPVFERIGVSFAGMAPQGNLYFR